VALESLGRDHHRLDWWSSLILVLSWVAWLSLMSAFELPKWLSLPMTSVVLLYGSYLWDFITGALFMLVMSWLHYRFSILPPGNFWLTLMISFFILKVITHQFELRSSLQVFGILWGVSSFMWLCQYVFLSRSDESVGWSWLLLGLILLSGLLQAVIGLVFTRPILEKAKMK